MIITSKKLLTKIIIVFLLLSLVLMLPVFGHAAASSAGILDDISDRYENNDNQPYIPDSPDSSSTDGFSIELLTFEKTIKSGQKFATIISYSYSSSQDLTAESTVIRLNVPNKLRCIDFYDQNLNSIDFELLSNNNGIEYILKLDAPIASSSVGNIVAVTKYADEDEDLFAPMTISATIDADNTPLVKSKDFIINPVTKTADWAVITYKESPADNPPLDSDVTYGITLYGNSPELDINMKNVTLVFDYPKNSIVSNADGGTVNTQNHTITWTISNLIAGEAVEKAIMVNYPSTYFCDTDSTESTKSDIANIKVDVSGNFPNTSEVFAISDIIQHNFVTGLDPSIGNTENYKTLDKTEYTTGEKSLYTVSGVANTGDTTFSDITVIYTVPEKTTLDFIQTGSYNLNVNVVAEYKYKGNDTWLIWDNSSYNNNKKLLASSLSNPQNIDKVKWTITPASQQIAPGFTSNNTIQVGSIVTGAYGDIFDVSSTITATYGGSEVISSECKDKYKVFPILPENLSDKRKQIVETAYSLVGKVPYFWGAKSTAIGWDERWTKSTYNDVFNRYEPYGLDCSGYTQWVYINSGFSISYVTSNFGPGTIYQWPNSQSISWDDLLPGDLAFKQSPETAGINHVGVFVGQDASGNYLVANCAGGSIDGVVISKYNGYNYKYKRRPNILLDYPY